MWIYELLLIYPFFFCEAERTVVAIGVEIDRTWSAPGQKVWNNLTLVTVKQTKEKIETLVRGSLLV